MNASDSASGRAPPTARSLTVPLTASSPMSPPGKKIGVTTYESVVKASRAAARVGEQRLVVERARAPGSEAPAGSAARSAAAVSCPPLPWPEQDPVGRRTGRSRAARRLRGHRPLPARRAPGPRAGAEHGVGLLDAVDRPARHDERRSSQRSASGPPSRPANADRAGAALARAAHRARFTLAEVPERGDPEHGVLAAREQLELRRRTRARSRRRCRSR